MKLVFKQKYFFKKHDLFPGFQFLCIYMFCRRNNLKKKMNSQQTNLLSNCIKFLPFFEILHLLPFWREKLPEPYAEDIQNSKRQS